MSIQYVPEVSLPKAINWHLEARCNYRCKFCFVKFKEFHHAHVHSEEQVVKMYEQLLVKGAEKITFVGGEPMLYPKIKTWITLAKTMGFTTCMVSNGTRLTSPWLESMVGHLDWIGVSIDASTDVLHAKMGRANIGEVKKGVSEHLARTTRAYVRARELGYGMKLNTVVCDINKNDDMCELVEMLKPDRWKVFRVLRVDGENDEQWDELGINQADFNSWVSRHHHLNPVVEDNNDMMGSYAMLDAKGRFFTDATGINLYSLKNVFQHGVDETWSEMGKYFSPEKFEARDGDWSWK
jgi:radical S-adenosyl methionine domain-containing protein 2